MFVFIAAGMSKVEVKNQHVQAGTTAKQQGVYTTQCIPLCYFYVAYLLVIQQIKHV